MELVSRPKPKAGQSPGCYAGALASKNGYPSVSRMMSAVFGDFDLDPIDLNSGVLEKVTGHCFCPVSGLHLLRDDRKRERFYRYGNVSVPAYQICRTEKYCPQCYAEEPVVKGKWRIGWLPLCVKHECFLEDIKIDLHGPRHARTISKAPNLWKSDLFVSEFFSAQKSLEINLQSEAFGSHLTTFSTVDLIDEYLLKYFKLNSQQDLWKLKRRYNLKYFSLNNREALRFIHWIHSQMRLI